MHGKNDVEAVFSIMGDLQDMVTKGSKDNANNTPREKHPKGVLTGIRVNASAPLPSVELAPGRKT